MLLETKPTMVWCHIWGAVSDRALSKACSLVSYWPKRDYKGRFCREQALHWLLLVLQGSLKVWWQECQPSPTATDFSSITLGHCICDPLLLSLTMADNRKQQRCEGIWPSSHLRAALVVRPNARKWLARSAGKCLCEQKDWGGSSQAGEQWAAQGRPSATPARAIQPILSVLPVTFLQQHHSTVKGTHCLPQLPRTPGICLPDCVCVLG